MKKTQLQEWKAQAMDRIDAARDELFDLSRKIQSHPEVGFKEMQASAWLSDYVEAQGFAVELTDRVDECARRTAQTLALRR